MVENEAKQRGMHFPTCLTDERTIMFSHLHLGDMHLGLILGVCGGTA